ncbi:MAG: CidB/LrgB family autolysis modulator [Paenibacillus macerans]|uniref:LrgB-like family protein n=1 Tax=Paenibacillus macerans TaxID=44252 RepID=A0A090Y7G0_PAEMA|nr:CidB/LrgB family autolysis modulator [Paenibacillus macerans]KFM94698.1 lrgB-like family protein [Paenibacillus macerans]MBS5912574.1 CidB/LrgB family autolysis modulator [Paenibacillus macerans]MCY7558630.1 CidB/LrgB family autolysis modulator [Paenibacillus macerans]MDU5948402.1 CidB/LrgB family autolysis modulator [Paenibacillus macerans]MDU7475456.1 CidB/LrgB family autolysis modulator [Paenibacillus macerans]
MITGLLSLVFTLVIYYLAKRLYKIRPKVYLSPLLITPLFLVIGLMWAQIPYETYQAGGKWLSTMLQPATVAFAVPLYKYYNVLKKHAVEILISVLTGSVVAMFSSAFLAEWLHLDNDLITSLIPRSITTPIAMNVSQVIGGVPNITAVFVIITGLLGTMLGPLVVKLFRIENEVARGVLFGTSAHGTGTSKAFELSSLTGTISSISMILAALFTLGAAPMLISLLQ